MATGNAINADSAGLVKYDGAGTFSGVTVTQHDLLVGASSNGITSLPLTAGQIAIGTTGSDPTAATITGGTGISVVSASGSITINGVGAGLTWTVIATGSQAMTSNNGYIANNGSLITFTLPTTSAVGDMIAVTDLDRVALAWKIVQGTGQQIFFGNTNTTTTTGSLASSQAGDSVFLVCLVANLTWGVVSSVGNITVV